MHPQRSKVKHPIGLQCIRMLHVVDLLVREHLAWSESLNARTQRGGSCLSIRCTGRGTLAKYRPSLLRLSQPASHGSLMRRAISLHDHLTSGRSSAKLLACMRMDQNGVCFSRGNTGTMSLVVLLTPGVDSDFALWRFS